jgi:hypothetical protein
MFNQARRQQPPGSRQLTGALMCATVRSFADCRPREGLYWASPLSVETSP